MSIPYAILVKATCHLQHFKHTFYLDDVHRNNIMIPGSKGLNPHELAHRWVKDLGTRPDMSIKVG